jgi:two-component system, LytTR family, sensor kinase
LISFFTVFIITTFLLLITKVLFKAQNLSNLYPYIGSFSNNSIVLVILNLITLQHNKSKIEIENADLKFNKLFAEQEHLKNQLHPHFLFNALATLKSLIKKYPDQAEEYVKRLSDFLRTSITMSDKNTITLERELELCIDYLEMQKMRFKDALNYTINIPIEELKHFRVPTFAIQLLIENAIKHNAFTMDDPLHVLINHHQHIITVENNILAKKNQTPSTHLGLKNLSDRYLTLTGRGIEITKTETRFIIEIYLIRANENNNN